MLRTFQIAADASLVCEDESVDADQKNSGYKGWRVFWKWRVFWQKRKTDAVGLYTFIIQLTLDL